MTLLETLVALVVLGLAAVGFLEAFQTTTRSTLQAETWTQAVGYAEEAMEHTKLGADQRALAQSMPPGFTRQIEAEPFPGLPGVERVTVTVTLPGGRAFVLHRLVRRS